MCTSKIYPLSPHRREWNFLVVGWFYETNSCRRNVWSLTGISRGVGRCKKKSLPWGGMDIPWNYTNFQKPWWECLWSNNSNDALGGFIPLVEQMFLSTNEHHKQIYWFCIPQEHQAILANIASFYLDICLPTILALQNSKKTVNFEYW